MKRLQVIRPGDDQLTRLQVMMLDAGWTTMYRRGFAYVLTRKDERVYAIPSGWVCHAGEDDSWIDPILDTYGEGWLEERTLPDEDTEGAVLRLFADVVLDEIGRRIPYRAGIRVDEHDINRFDRRTGEWIRTVDDLIDMCDGRCEANDLIRLQQEWENTRANLVKAHEPVNEKVLDRLQMFTAIIAVCDLGQFLIAFFDENTRMPIRIGVALVMLAALLILLQLFIRYRK